VTLTSFLTVKETLPAINAEITNEEKLLISGESRIDVFEKLGIFYIITRPQGFIHPLSSVEYEQQ